MGKSIERSVLGAGAAWMEFRRDGDAGARRDRVIAPLRAAGKGRGLPALVVPAIGAGYQPFTAIFMLPGALLPAASTPGRPLPAPA